MNLIYIGKFGCLCFFKYVCLYYVYGLKALNRQYVPDSLPISLCRLLQISAKRYGLVYVLPLIVAVWCTGVTRHASRDLSWFEKVEERPTPKKQTNKWMKKKIAKTKQKQTSNFQDWNQRMGWASSFKNQPLPPYATQITYIP